MHSLEDFVSDDTTASGNKEGLLQDGEGGTTPNLKESPDKSTGKKSWKTRLREVNWKNILIMACLWLAVLLSSVAYSMVAPFFPSKVRNEAVDFVHQIFTTVYPHTG